MTIDDTLDNQDFVLNEAAIIESLRRSADITLHPQLENALLIYDDTGKSTLTRLYQDFIAVAHKGGLPITICTPTWRANRHRISEARITDDVNGVKILGGCCGTSRDHLQYLVDHIRSE